jgi:acetyl esterase/lipase
MSILDSADLRADDADIVGARRLNRLLTVLPRFHTGRRWNARFVQILLDAHRRLPDRRRRTSKVSVLRIPGTSSLIRLTKPLGQERGMLLHFHGGAWVMGAARLEDRLAAQIACDCNMLVAAVDFPNAINDDLASTTQECVATTTWVVRNLKSFGVDGLILSGESSGAHLAMESLLSLRSASIHGSVRGFYSVCGAFDLEGSRSLRASSGKALLINGPSALANLGRLTPSLPADLRRGPLHADLQDLPSALFIAGGLDPISDDSINMHDRWDQTNGNAHLVIVPEGPHGFNRMPTRLAGKTNAFGRQWIGKHIAN